MRKMVKGTGISSMPSLPEIRRAVRDEAERLTYGGMKWAGEKRKGGTQHSHIANMALCWLMSRPQEWRDRVFYPEAEAMLRQRLESDVEIKFTSADATIEYMEPVEDTGRDRGRNKGRKGA